MLMKDVAGLGGKYTPKTDPVEAKIVELVEDYNGKPNEWGYMVQKWKLYDGDKVRDFKIATKFESGILDKDAAGGVHKWLMKDYKGELEGYSLTPRIMGTERSFGSPTPGQDADYTKEKEATVKKEKETVYGKCFTMLLAGQLGLIPAEDITMKTLYAIDEQVGYCMNGLPPRPATPESIKAAQEEAVAAHEAKEVTGDEPHTQEDMGEPNF